MKPLLAAIFSLPILVFALLVMSNNGTAESPLAKSNPPTVSGKVNAIPDSLKNKTLVVNMWATWCKPCIEEMPALNSLQAKYQSDEIVFIALTAEDSAVVASFVSKRSFSFNYHIIPGAGKLMSELRKSASALSSGMEVLPVNLILGPDMKLLYYREGAIGDDAGEMKAVLESAIAGAHPLVNNPS